jgi:hypothetical protein
MLFGGVDHGSQPVEFIDAKRGRVFAVMVQQIEFDLGVAMILQGPSQAPLQLIGEMVADLLLERQFFEDLAELGRPQPRQRLSGRIGDITARASGGQPRLLHCETLAKGFPQGFCDQYT